MLVFQRKFKHIVDGCTRASITPEWLIECVAEINLYMPNDWRMTRTNNRFRVQIVSATRQVALLGWSFRSDGQILHVIDTIGLCTFFDQYSLREAGISDGHVSNNDLASVENSISPNVYFFRSCPDDSPSPLLARQYEKLKSSGKGKWSLTQYHRVHALSKSGVDPDHFKWIVFDVSTGRAEFVDYPASGYHGKDYWVTEELSASPNRANREAYVSDLQRLMGEYGVRQPLPEESPLTPYEVEHKFTVDPSIAAPAAVFNAVRKFVTEDACFDIEEDGKSVKQDDIYFDDAIFTLYRCGASFRFRGTPRSARVTLKVRPRGEDAAIGAYRRIEEEAMVSREQVEALKNGKPVGVFPYRALAYVAPGCGPLTTVAKVSNWRRILLVQDQDCRKAEICLDTVTYNIGGKQKGPYYEIELESKGMPRDELAALAELLGSSISGLTPSPLTKYERAVLLMHPDGVPGSGSS